MKRELIRINVMMGNPPSRKSLSYTQACELASSLVAAGQFGIAAQLAEQLVRIVPEDTDALLFAADISLRGKNTNGANAYLARAARLCGNTAPVLLMRARIALELDDGALAITSLDQLVGLDENNHLFYMERGDAQQALGNSRQAQSDYTRAFELNSRDTRSLLQLSRLPAWNMSIEQIQHLESLLSDGQLHEPEQIYAYFVLAGAYDKSGDRQQQFHNLHKGNALAGRHHKHDTRQHQLIVKKCVEHFSKSFFEEMPAAEPRKQNIIFILGMPRSGSTLIEQILCSHSKVRSVGENSYMHDAVKTFLQTDGRGLDFPEAINPRASAKLTSIAQNYLKSIGDVGDEEVIVDKSWGDYLYPGLLALLFPNARFIHSRRHPVATCYGCYKVLFGSGLVPFAYSFEHLVSQYQDVDKTLEHWKAVLPAKFHTVQYESLVHEQESETRKLLRFCGLDWEESCLAFYQRSGTVATASSVQVRQTLYTHATDEWRKLQGYLGPLMSLLD